MFCEKEILQAFERIYDLFDKEIMKVMEENHSEEMDIPYDILVQAVRDKAMTVYEYRAIADAPCGLTNITTAVTAAKINVITLITKFLSVILRPKLFLLLYTLIDFPS